MKNLVIFLQVIFIMNINLSIHSNDNSTDAISTMNEKNIKIENKIDENHKKLASIEEKIKNNTFWDKIATVLIPLISLLLSAFVLVFNHLENKKKNIVDVITKARIQWIYELRNICSDFIFYASLIKNIDDSKKCLNQIKLYLNERENSVKIINYKLNFVIDILLYFKRLDDNNNLFLEFYKNVQQTGCHSLNEIIELKTINLSKIDTSDPYFIDIFNILIKKISKNNELLEKLGTDIYSQIKNEYQYLVDYENDLNNKIIEINRLIKECDNSINIKYNKLTIELEIFDNTSIKNYFINKLLSNISLSFNDYFKNEWDKAKEEIKK